MNVRGSVAAHAIQLTCQQAHQLKSRAAPCAIVEDAQEHIGAVDVLDGLRFLISGT
ncbi:MAG: hypothetical protein J2P21_28320 [Chloracidobacterium sp.]|nr:hypothetical protein [Chloracidobacterium sp.]